jgi:hypothetical protein
VHQHSTPTTAPAQPDTTPDPALVDLVARHRATLDDFAEDDDHDPSSFVVGYLTGCLEGALRAHPGDPDLISGLAMSTALDQRRRAIIDAAQPPIDAALAARGGESR